MEPGCGAHVLPSDLEGFEEFDVGALDDDSAGAASTTSSKELSEDIFEGEEGLVGAAMILAIPP